MSVHGAAWDRDEAFRQSVIRKAVLLGFSAQEYEVETARHSADVFYRRYWRFTFEGKWHDSYASCYSAAFDYLRLNKLEYLAGDYRG